MKSAALVASLRDSIPAGKSVVFCEAGVDEVTLRAAAQCQKQGICTPILLGRREDFRTTAAALGIDLEKSRIVNPADDPSLEEAVKLYSKGTGGGGLTPDQARAQLLADPALYGCALASLGLADGVVAGRRSTTAHVVNSARKLIPQSAADALFTSYSLLGLGNDSPYGHKGMLLFADCAVIADPTPEEAALIALTAVQGAKTLWADFEPKVAMLSFSTRGSAAHPRVDKVSRATTLAREKLAGIAVDGEMQADAAIVPAVGQKKAKDSPVGGKANLLVFPDLDSASTSFKLLRSLASASGVGPVLRGLARPVAAVDEKSDVDDVVLAAAIVALAK